MHTDEQSATLPPPTPLTLLASDGQTLAAQHWLPAGTPAALVVINPATAVKAAYYHRFARFLTTHGFAVLTYDYRGIGESRQGSLRPHRRMSKLDWGRYDCDAALAWAKQHYPTGPIHVVAHSIGGLLVGLARNNDCIVRCLTVGAQYAYWPDYDRQSRWSMWWRWHVLMPLLTLLLGYFPARRLGWHEDLPAAAAYEWAFRSAKLEKSYRRQRHGGADPLSHFDTLTGDILAISLTDDPFGTPAAIHRLLDYFRRSHRYHARITPASAGVEEIGHFAFFHERFRDSLWQDALRWLQWGRLPRPEVEERLPGR